FQLAGAAAVPPLAADVVLIGFYALGDHDLPSPPPCLRGYILAQSGNPGTLTSVRIDRAGWNAPPRPRERTVGGKYGGENLGARRIAHGVSGAARRRTANGEWNDVRDPSAACHSRPGRSPDTDRRSRATGSGGGAPARVRDWPVGAVDLRAGP